MFTSRMMSSEPRFLHVHRSHGAEPELECRTSRLDAGTMRSVGIFALSGSDSLQRARRSARRLAGRRTANRDGTGSYVPRETGRARRELSGGMLAVSGFQGTAEERRSKI